MALITPKCIFFDVPRCGSVWVRDALRCAGLSCDIEISSRHCFPIEVDVRNRFSFCFVRNPYSWYEAMFARQKLNQDRHPKSGIKHFDDLAQTNTFEDFLENSTFSYPGYLSNLYKLYTGVDANWELNFIGRFENLKQDLIAALKQANEDFNEQAILDLEDEGLSLRRNFNWPDHLKQAVQTSEAFAFARFGYEIDSRH